MLSAIHRMKKIKQKYGLLLIGVSIGVLYGLITRIVFDEKATLASVTYLFIIPTLLGIVPLIFANNEQLKSYKNIIFIPWLTTATFFLTMFLIGLEEFICLLVLAGPFFILGTLGAFIYRLIQLNREKRKGKLLSLLIIPFLLSPFEQAIKSPSSIYKVESEVVILSTSEKVWDNIIEVKPILEEEYKSGFFNRIGIPRPISAEVDIKKVGGERTGHFEGGLEFKERINEYDLNNSVSFSINVTPESIRKNVFDQHVLNGNYFNFVDATYKLTELENGKVLLKLSSNYQLTSKINLYGKFWGDIILGDFQERLLNVIENRCEAQKSF